MVGGTLEEVRGQALCGVVRVMWPGDRVQWPACVPLRRSRTRYKALLRCGWCYPTENSMASNVDKRIRGRQLQAIREHHLRLHPLCVHCLAAGTVREGTQVDHVLALVNGGEEVESNRQTLCDDCHKVKTAADLGHTVRVPIGLDGWPVNTTSSPFLTSHESNEVKMSRVERGEGA